MSNTKRIKQNPPAPPKPEAPKDDPPIGVRRFALSKEQNDEGLTLLRTKMLAEEAFNEWVGERAKAFGVQPTQGVSYGLNYDSVLARLTATPQRAG